MFFVSSRCKDLLSPLRGGAIVGEQGLQESAAMRDMASLFISQFTNSTKRCKQRLIKEEQNK